MHGIEIDKATGCAAFVTARQDAWHRLGTVTTDTFTAEDAMRLAHLGNWNVHTVPVDCAVLGDDGVTRLRVPDRYATVRTHPFTGRPDVLGIVGNDYHPVQNEAHADLLNTLVDEAGAHFETAGSLHDGRQVFVTMRLPRTLRLGGGDDVDLFIAALNSHDGSSAFRLIVTPTRIVCANTQAAALRNAHSTFAIRHTSGARGHIAEARQALGLTWAWVDAFEAEAQRMIETELRRAEFDSIVADLFPEPTVRTPRRLRHHAGVVGALGALLTAPTMAGIEGTRWAGYQAVTEYLDHHAAVSGGKTRGEDFAADARAVRTVTSPTVNKIKSRAFEALRV
ncbi:DUF932 domain-containing protein [Embleya scabrispora]|uniref:DUF932 domain-containing protein n=1 Tax=Embleya scabrispora TaxID=159449 RepID=UPI00191456CD|nr:DUF932 domain-containing protein [Embleya scabrispora]